MTTAFQRVRQVFEAALDVPVGQREAWLAHECGDDAGLLAEVAAMLAKDTQGGELAAVLDRGASPLVAARGEPLLGAVVDGFVIRAVLGSGGMGTVYEAEQQEPRRLVALKVLSLGLRSEAAVRRFRWEAEVLARLQHPNIAQVFAVGVHKSGGLELPWFAMERVPGAQALDEFAAARRLGPRQRVALLLQACEAVHHGHLHGVVHRDLKPANVLVDADGRVKVIDFGIARGTGAAAADDDTAAAPRTEGGFVLGTLAYMSPEQLDGRAVDLRTDVYALGVVAFELLAGRLPHPIEGLSPWRAAAVLREHAPLRLSRVVPGLDADLDLVVHKAMAVEPSARYASVAAFADDLRAWLAARPVTARPPSTFYQLRMFARRRRGLVAGIAAVLLVALVGLAVWITTDVERRRQQRMAARTAQFARDFLAESDVMRDRGADYTVREALDEAAKHIDAERFEEPTVEAELRQLMGDAYAGLSVAEAAAPQLERALALRRTALGPTARATVESELSALLVTDQLGDTDGALTRLRALQQRTAGAFTADDPLALRLSHNEAFLLRGLGKLGEAEAIYRRVLAARERVLGTDAEDTLVTMQNLGTLLLASNRPALARDVLQECLTRAERTPRPRASTWQIADNLAETWRELGELDRAAAAHRRLMADYAALLGPDHALTIGCGFHLLKVLDRQQKYDELAALAADLLVRAERTFGKENYKTMFLWSAAAKAQLQTGAVAAACGCYERIYEVQRKNLAPAHPDLFVAGQNLVRAQLTNPDGAARALEVSTALMADLATAPDLPPVHAALTRMLHAEALARAGRAADALPFAAAADKSLRRELPADHALVQHGAQVLAEVKKALGG